MYTFQSRVRYSEISQHQTLDISNIINYFQDCSTFQSEDLGVGIEYLKENHRAWILNSWQIIINTLPKLGDMITVGTWAYDFKTFYGYRNFIMKDQSGQVCACANSIWLYMDTETYRPVKVSDEVLDTYHLCERYNMPYADRKIKLPEDLTSYPEFQVMKLNIDTNNHVNNCQYIKMAEEFLPCDFHIGQVRAEYKKSAVLGNMIFPKVSSSDDMVTVSLTDEANQPYAIVEFSRNK